MHPQWTTAMVDYYYQNRTSEDSGNPFYARPPLLLLLCPKCGFHAINALPSISGIEPARHGISVLLERS